MKQLKHQLGAFHPESASAAAAEHQEAAAAADASLVPKKTRVLRPKLGKVSSADNISSASSSSSADPVSMNHNGNVASDSAGNASAVSARQAELGKLAHADWPSESGWRAKVIGAGLYE